MSNLQLLIRGPRGCLGESGRTRTCMVDEGEVTRVEVQIIRRGAVPLVYALPAFFTGLRSQVGAVRRVRSEVS